MTNGNGSITGDFSGKGYKHFKITRGSGVAYWSKIEITYETGGDPTPGKTDVELEFSSSTATATLGQTFTAPTLTVDPEEAASEVVYSSSNTDVATVDASTGAVTLVAAGTTTITAEISGSETYKDTSDSYTLTVKPDLTNAAILDFTEVDYWTPNLPDSDHKITDEQSFNDGTYTVKITGTTGSYWTSNYMLVGKEGAYIQLPAFNRAVTRIDVEGTNTASASVTQNIFVGETAVSTQTLGKGDHSYDIASNYQAAGNIYTLKVTNGYNTQVKKIIIHFDENSSEVPLISVTPSSVTITDVTGDDKTGTISATVNPAGTVNATATDGWSATSSSVTYQGLALHAEGTATFSSTGATDVEASLEYNYTGPLYILGTVNNSGWAPNNYVEMTRGTDGLYTARVTTNAGNEGMSWISFTKRIANDNDNGAWGYIAPYRFVPYSENVNTAWWLTDGNVNQFNALDFNTDHVDGQPVRMAPGTYDITINPNDNTFKIEPYIVTVETPTFDPEAGSYKTFQSVTINCATEDATIHYTTDGSEPTESSPVYSEPIAVESTTTIKAIAMKSGMANSAIAEATYNLPQTVANVADAMGVAANSYFLFTGEAVVTYAGQSTINSNYHYIFIRDKGAKNGGGVIYYNTNNNNVTVPSVQATNVLKRGWYAQLRPYNSWKEFQKAEFVEASGETAAAAPFDRTGKELKYDDNVNEYVKIDNVTYNEGNITYAGQNREDVTYTYKVVNHFNVALEEGKHYNIEGVVTRNNNTIEFYPTAATLAKQDPNMVFAEQTVNATFGADFNEPALTKPEGVTVTYSSSDPTVAEVDATTGEVTIKKVGNATITATSVENQYYTAGTASYNIVVTAGTPTFAYSAGTKEVVFGTENPELPTLSNPNELTVTYSSSKPEVATVNETGKVTIVGIGETVIKATGAATGNYAGAEAQYTLTVTAATPTFAYSADAKEVVFGAENPELPTLNNPNSLTVTYTSSKPAVATVNENGEVTIVGIGETVIKATGAATGNYAGAEAQYTLTVTAATPTFAYSADAKEVVFGTENPELPTLSNPNSLNVTYTSSKPEVATVNENGEVTIVSIGETVIKATGAATGNYAGAEAQYTLTVTAGTPTFAYSAATASAVFGQTATLPTLSNPNNLTVTYTSSKPAVATVDETGKVTIVGAGTTTITATGAATGNYAGAVAQYTLTVSKADLEVSFNETPNPITIGDSFTAPVLSEVPEGTTVTYKSSNENVAKVNATTGEVEIVGVGSAVITATVTGDNYNETSASYTITVNDVEVAIAAPTFAPAAGTYTEAKEVAIACATPGVTIEYTIDGVTKTYEGPFLVNRNCTVTATAKMGTRTVYTPATSSATYKINVLPAAQIDNKYYYLVNNALPEMYANVAGRRTLNFVADPADKAGTVFRVMTDPDTIGQVETLRSQGVDMQGYAKRAMNYVTPIVQMVVNKLNDMDGVDDATGTGSILGENGLGKILAEFNKSFDYHLYVEGNAGAYRIYARTPSMQRVVDFYNNPDNKSQIQEKLPMLEGYINQVLAKIRSKVPAGMNANVFEPFSLVKVWEKMGSKLIKPVKGENDDITAIMAFYDQVLSNKEYVWDFAYQTAKIYLDNIKGTKTYADLDPEYKLYIEKMEEIRPETKFFIIQNGNELDYVREDHTYIQNNNDQTFWTLTERTDFTVNFPEENKYGSKLVTTLYTDFAYDVPDNVTAYKITGIDANGIAKIADLGKNVPAQTPVLLMTDATAKATTKNVTLNTTDGTRPNGNLLEGPDYLINKYKITSPTVEALFAIAAGIVGGEESDAYQTYVKPYEYLKLRTSGTVNNRYFWGLNSDDLKKCSEKNSEDKLDCVVRSLGVNDEGKDIGFYRNREALLANQAFIPNIEFNPILLEVVATPTFDPEAGTYNEAQTVTIACETEGATIYYKMGDEENWTEYDPEQPINVAQTTTIQAYAVKDGLGDSEIAEATYTIELPAEAPTFNPVPGSYEEAQDVTIIAPEGATVSYRIDGGEWQTYTEGEEIHVDATQTIEAKVVMEGMSESAVATGYYVIDIPEALPTNMPVFDGYYSILNSGKYANVQGRKTLTFTTEPDAQAGTVIRLKSDNTGKVEVLRSQAADLQRYAYRALDYVPDIVQIVVDKLGAEGEGHILGQEGLDAIMDKFDKSFKPDLYIEKAGENGYRIYGETPSMQPVVDFYRENKDKVEAKLPDLVAFINSALAKLRAKAEQAGMNGDNVFVDFDLKTIWERMGGNLTDPEVDEMGFYRDVLNYKDNVWNFAYQTATFYLEKIKNTGTYESLLDELGEYAQYLDKIDQIHPDFKYYIVANEGVTKPDFISEGNTDIANDAARTIWTIEPRENFTVNFPAENKLGDEYVTTLYTDFAYTLPEGVTAWAVESVNEYGIAKLAKVDGTTIAAQTPVLLKSTTAGDVATFGITTAEGTVPATNELVGPDYLIETYQIKTPEVVKLFEAIKSVLGENIYNDLVEDYGHLQLRNSGTVNNKYFWGLNEEEVKSCAETNPETGKLVKVVRSLGIKDDILGFNDNEHVYTNKALLVSTEHSAINFTLRGDINRDGQITIADVPALIDILLELPAEPYHEPSELYPNYPKGLDYEAADFNENGDITIHDVSALIDYLLGV
ncbi:MAG: chitobiase/beta-hexosaminidase C-terminal domain-containing protein [Muribaculaceae bacterium]|nr:chitobiase/beta-hexosaminidase C-terminal domain-containing protein [Muribaculaceae bacterium]